MRSWRRLDGFRSTCGIPEAPLFIWLRFITLQELQSAHRRHLRTKGRDARREVPLHRGPLPEASSEALAAHLLSRGASPSEGAAQAELRIRLEEILDRMDPLEREIVALRHFEQLSSAESAQILGIEEAAERQRYLRALKKLKDILSSKPEFRD